MLIPFEEGTADKKAILLKKKKTKERKKRKEGRKQSKQASNFVMFSTETPTEFWVVGGE